MTQVFTLFEGRAPYNEPDLGPKVKFSVKCGISKKGIIFHKVRKLEGLSNDTSFHGFRASGPLQ